MRFEVFGKPNCAKCKSTKDKLTHLLGKSGGGASAAIAFVDMDTVEGLAEAAFQDVHEAPTTILRSDGGEMLARWDGKLPPTTEVHAFLSSRGA